MLTGGLGSQLVEFVGGESNLRELPQCRGVELDVGRSNHRHVVRLRYWRPANRTG